MKRRSIGNQETSTCCQNGLEDIEDLRVLGVPDGLEFRLSLALFDRLHERAHDHVVGTEGDVFDVLLFDLTHERAEVDLNPALALLLHGSPETVQNERQDQPECHCLLRKFHQLRPIPLLQSR